MSAVCVFPESVPAQYQDVRFKRISSPEGLSQDIVKTIVQDSRGFMWFGTEDGLNRYDGYSIRVYKNNQRDTTSISHNDIHDIFEDSRQRLWIGTGSGLNFLNRNTESFQRFNNDPGNPSSISHNGVTSMCEDTRGNLWVGTHNGLNRFEEQSHAFIRYFHDPRDSTTINSNNINSVLLDKSGTLWVATDNGFCMFDEKRNRFVRYLYARRSVNQSNVTSLYEDRSGTIWVARTALGLLRLDPARKRLEPVPVEMRTSFSISSKSLGDAVVEGIAEDAYGSVWIGHFRGLDIYDPRTKIFSHFSIHADASAGLGGRVGVVYRDKVGMMWLGTYQSGVYRYDPNRQKFHLYRNDPTSKNSLNSNYVSAVFEDGSGNVWIGTEQGLDRLDARTNTFSHYRHNPADPGSIGSNQVNAILEDRNGSLWVGGTGGSASNLDRFDMRQKRFVHYPVKSVRSLLEDRNGELWAGLLDESNTGENLIRMDQKRNIVARYSVPGTGVWCIYEDREGDIWLGGQYCCLNKFDRRTNRFVPYEVNLNDTAGLSSGAVRTMYQDEAGNMWLGTWSGGLYKYDMRANQFVPFLEQDGLPSNYVKGMLPDIYGNLWIATEKGISRFDPKTLTFKNFTTENGLQGDRFLSGSCFRGKDGRMYFGGTNGLNIFHPDSIRDNQNIPPVVITNFKILDKQVALPQSISTTKMLNLAHRQDFFSFEFVALDYTAPHRNQYAYLLEGFDRDWVEAGTRRYAAYTGVPPGEYVFRVRGSNNDGVWNNDGAAVRIVIAPPFWRTWWFTALAVMTAAALLYSLYRYRVNQLLAIERLRTRIASDLHDDVGTDLSSIVLATQAMERKLPHAPVQRDELRQIGSIAKRTQDLMRDIVWVLNSRNDSMGALAQKMREVAGRVLGGISFTFDAPAAPFEEKMSLDFKRTIFLFYKECLNNIVKHASATTVKIEIQSHDGQLVLRIADNGKGFKSAMPTTGLGLTSLRARAEHVGGRLAIDSDEAVGTRISLTVKTT